MISPFYSNGKLLLTGEYVVLDGTEALALPTIYGQELVVKSLQEPTLVWESYNHDNKRWLQVVFDLPRLRIISATFDASDDGGNDTIAEKLQKILVMAKRGNEQFLSDNRGFLVTSKLTFPRNWGLGSSSTLINNIAQWAVVDPFALQFDSFGGSGYDIACAKNNSPIIYSLKNKKPRFRNSFFNPSFKNQLYFIYLNKKQNSRDGIAAYRTQKKENTSIIAEISTITHQINTCTSLTVFEKLLVEHETIISKIIGQEPIQQGLFSDYFGQTKSLGAWGGDFILATGNDDTPVYFKKKGFETVILYSDMIL